MAYLIFIKEQNVDGSIFKLAEDINSLNIIKNNVQDLSTLNIIEVSTNEFDTIKLYLKLPFKYNNNNQVVYLDNPKIGFQNKTDLESYINGKINAFSINRIKNVDYTQFDLYIEQLKNVNLNTINFPLNTTLEQYFKDNQKSYYNHLQLY